MSDTELQDEFGPLAKSEDKPFGGRLENWRSQEVGMEGHVIIWGNLFDDPRNRFGEGRQIHTSYIMKLDHKTVETRNTKYELGEPFVQREPVTATQEEFDEALKRLAACIC